MSMGRQKLADKTIRPLTTLTNLTPASVTGGINTNSLGRLPIGVYKGAAAFWDLDKAVNQPLVTAEQQYIVGLLSGREEDYDLQTAGIVLAEVIGTAHTLQLTVPAGELWYVTGIETTVPASAGVSQYGTNWFCDLWTDRVGALGFGQPFWGAEQLHAAGGGNTFDEFGVVPVAFAVSNKPVALRAPAGTVFTFIATTRTLACDLAINITFQVWGYLGNLLVA